MSEAFIAGSIGHPSQRGPSFGVRVGNGPLVHVTGELDYATAPALAAALEPLVASGGVIGVDMAGLAFVDVTGLAVLREAAASLGGRGQIVVYDPPPATKWLIELSGLADVIVVDDRHTARSVHRRRRGRRTS